MITTLIFLYYIFAFGALFKFKLGLKIRKLKIIASSAMNR